MDNLPARSEVVELTSKFLAERRRSAGGFANITTEDSENLSDIVRALIIAKCEADPDGDRPIEFDIFDATKIKPLSFGPIPYDHDVRSEDELDSIMKRLVYNLQVAHNEFSTFMSRRDGLIKQVNEPDENDFQVKIKPRKTPDPRPCDPTRVLSLIEHFLSEPRESHGGWAQIVDADIKELESIIKELISAKCEQDPDGDYPYEFVVVDRTKFERMHFRPVPHEHQARTEEEIESIMDTYYFNLSIAHGALETFLRVRRLVLKQIKKPA